MNPAADVSLFAPESKREPVRVRGRDMRVVDVLVLTAVQDELEAFLDLVEGGRNAWKQERDAEHFPLFRHTFNTAQGQPFTVAAAWIGEMGQRSTAIRGLQLLQEFDPSYLAMCGVCAGYRKDVALGDIIVADQIWAADDGKLVVEEGKPKVFYHALRTFDMKATWAMDAAFHARDFDRSALVATRPLSREAQRRWILHTQHAHETDKKPPPTTHPDRAGRCPDWTATFDSLVDDQLLTFSNNSEFALTSAGKDSVARDLVRYPDGLPDDRAMQVHVGAIATVSAVIKDPSIFSDLRIHVRNTIGLEMEGAAIGELAKRFEKPSILVKAVQDYADGSKDDTFRAFACKAAAEFLFAFLEKRVEPKNKIPVPRAHRIFESERDPERDNPFVGRIERAAALRHPKASITRESVLHPFAVALCLQSNEAYLETELVVALDAPISDETWRRFCSEVQHPARARDPWVRLTLVHRGETSPREILNDAGAQRITVRTFHEYQGLFDMKPYLEWQTKRLLGSEIYPPSLYVDAPAEWQVSGNRDWTKIDNALKYLWELLASSEQRRFALVLGEFGAGKTFLLRELARRMHMEKHPVWPVLLEMHLLEKRHDLAELLGAHFAKADVRGFNVPAFQYMLSEGRIALLFDGFDELADRVTYDTVTDHFNTVLSAAQGEQAKVILSSRRQHFLSENQVKLALTEQAQRVQGFRLVMLKAFGEVQIRRFLRNTLGDEHAADERYKLIDGVNDLLGLSHNPRMLGFIAKIPEAKLLEAKERKQETITSADLYELLVKEWLDGEHARLQRITTQTCISRRALDEGVTALAISMWHARVKDTVRDQIRDVMTEAMRRLNEPAQDPRVIEHLFGAGSLLVRDAEGRFSFVHRSVMEWLVAREAAGEVRQGKDSAALAADDMSELMVDFFVDMAGREVALGWAEASAWREGEPWVKKNATILRVRIERRWGKGTVTRDTAIRLNFAGQDLQGRDLTEVDWRNADLRGTNLEGATLVEANLSGANLTGARLVCANLTRAKLVGARVGAAELQGARLLGADLSDVVGLDKAQLFRTNFAGASLPDAFDPSKVDPYGVAPILRQADPVCATRLAHSHAVAWDVTGELLAAGFHDGTVRIFDGLTGEPLRVLAGHANGVLSVAFSPDGQTIASGSSDNTVRLWDVSSGRERRTLNAHTNKVWSVAFSPDGKTIASGSEDNTVRLWDVSSGREQRELKGHTSWVTSVAFSPDGYTVASGSIDNTVRLWDASSGREQRTLQAHTSWVTSVAFSPDGKTIASGSDDETVRLWDATSGRERREFKGHAAWVWSVAFSPDGKTIASGSIDETVRLWDATSGLERHIHQGRTTQLSSVAFSLDGKTVASGSSDSTVRLWDATGGRSLRSLQGHAKAVKSVAVSPDGLSIASGSEDNTVRLWDASSGLQRPTLQGHADRVWSVAFSPDGQTIASGSSDTTVRLWDASSRLEPRTLQAHTSAVWSVAFSPDSKTVASGSSDKTVRLWDTTSGRERRTLQAHTSAVWSVAFSPDGKTVASGSSDKTVRLWDTTSGRERRELRHTGRVSSVAFSPDGKTVASGSSDTIIRLWDTTSGRELHTLKGHSTSVSSVAFSPDGKLLASASWDGTLRLWTVATSQCLAILLATPEGWVAFTPDGRYKYGGNIAGSFWHVVGLCRFEPGELDLELPANADFRALPPPPMTIQPVVRAPSPSPTDT